MANAREAKQWIELNDTRSDIASNIEAIKTEIEETEDEIKNFDKQFSSEHFCRTERFRIKEIEKQQAELKAERDEKGKILDEVKPTKERIKVLEEADLHTKAGEIKSAAKQIPEIEDDIKNLTAKIQKAESELSDISLEVKDFDGLIRRHDQTIKEETAKRENALREIERYKTDIKNTKQGKFQISVLNGKQARHERLQEKYLQLSDAFSRNGIQALIIDSEKLTFIEIAKGLFQILSGGRMALHFSTQKTLKNQKEVREDFELQLTIDGVTRPLNQASQGQQDLGKIVMRATLGIYFAQKNGSRIQTYCLDETTGALDEINRESYYDFLKYLLNYFEQIFVITHQDIAKSIACQVRINDDRKIEITV